MLAAKWMVPFFTKQTKEVKECLLYKLRFKLNQKCNLSKFMGLCKYKDQSEIFSIKCICINRKKYLTKLPI